MSCTSVGGFTLAQGIALVGSKIYVGRANGVSVCDSTLTSCVLKNGGGAFDTINVIGIARYKDTLYIGSESYNMWICDIDLTACTPTDGGGTFTFPSKFMLANV
jgi:hypothetical protein